MGPARISGKLVNRSASLYMPAPSRIAHAAPATRITPPPPTCWPPGNDQGSLARQASCFGGPFVSHACGLAFELGAPAGAGPLHDGDHHYRDRGSSNENGDGCQAAHRRARMVDREEQPAREARGIDKRSGQKFADDTEYLMRAIREGARNIKIILE